MREIQEMQEQRESIGLGSLKSFHSYSPTVMKREQHQEKKGLNPLVLHSMLIEEVKDEDIETKSKMSSNQGVTKRAKWKQE